MADTMYMLRGRLDDDLSWAFIGYPRWELARAKVEADRFTELYSRVEVLDQVTREVVYRATRKPIK